MLLLNVLAHCFYVERAAYLDLSFHTFTYIKTHSLFIQNNRFVAAVTQFVPLLAVYWQASISSILWLYSLAFTVYYTAVFALCAWPLRQQRVALAVPLLFTLLITDSFYWAQSEMPQTLAALLLYYAVVSGDNQQPLGRWLLGMALIPVVIYGHPLAIIAFTFLWGYDGLLHKRFGDWRYYALLGLAIGCYWLRTQGIEPGSYEAQRIDVMANVNKFFPLNRNFHHFLSLVSNQDFLRLSFSRYILLPLLLAALTIFYLRRRAWLRLLWVWLFVVGYSQLISISYPTGIKDIFYLENLYLPLGLFIAIPLSLELLPALPAPRLVAVAVAALFGWRLAVIWQAHEPVTAYQDWQTRVMHHTRELPSDKLALNQANFSAHFAVQSWSIAYESLLLSARAGADSARSLLIVPTGQEGTPQLAKPKALLSGLAEMSYADLNPHYFRLAATPYHQLNTPPPATSQEEMLGYISGMKDINLHLAAPRHALAAGAAGAVDVRISNPTATLLHSGLNGPYPTVLAYRFLDTDNWPASILPCFNPLELDVAGNWTQPLRFVAPARPGSYRLEVYLTSDGLRDWLVRTSVPVVVQ